MENFIIAVFLFLFLLEFCIEFILNELNLRYVRARWAEKKIPDCFRDKIGAEDYERSVQYTLARGFFGRWAETYGRGVTLFVLFSGVLGSLDRTANAVAQHYWLGVYGAGILFCLAVVLIFSLASLPTSIYSTFYLEAKFGFNKTTASLYIVDKLKALILGLVIGVPFLWVVLG
jgi:STE24 endopeptidase